MTIARYPNDSYITVGKVSDIGDCYEPNAPAPVDESWLERRNQRGGTFALDEDTYSRVKAGKIPMICGRSVTFTGIGQICPHR